MSQAAAAPGRLIIVDAEEPGRINLRYALAAHPHWQVAGECADAAGARALLASMHGAAPVDLVLLDIHMPGESGLALARELAAQDHPPLIVFVTAHDAHAVEAFSVFALDYLLKPVDDEDLARALGRAEAAIAQRQLAAHAHALRAWADSLRPQAQAGQSAYLRQLNVRSVGRMECVSLDEVMWIEAAGNYVELHLAGRCVLHRVAIGTLERHLDPACFMRVHRGALVRADQITALETGPDGVRSVLLRCGAKVPVSDRHLARVKSLLAQR
jgi:DNA-binding LytR/AlgR family response regulator